jgi:hypothetical protein
MHARTTTISLVLMVSSALAANNGWPGKPYGEVRAYAYNAEGDIDRPILKNGRLDHSVVNKRGIGLAPQQISRLVAAATGGRPLPRSMIACFNPRHAFVFYDASKKPVASVELCFECHNAAAEPQRPYQVFDVAALEKLARELKLPLIPK